MYVVGPRPLMGCSTPHREGVALKLTALDDGVLQLSTIVRKETPAQEP